MQARCAVCYREYTTLNWKGRQKLHDRAGATKRQSVAPGIIAEQKRQWQRDKFAKDIIQPFKGTGINPDFVKHYPDQAAKMFHPSEIRKVQRGGRGDASRSNPAYEHQRGI